MVRLRVTSTGEIMVPAPGLVWLERPGRKFAADIPSGRPSTSHSKITSHGPTVVAMGYLPVDENPSRVSAASGFDFYSRTSLPNARDCSWG